VFQSGSWANQIFQESMSQNFSASLRPQLSAGMRNSNIFGWGLSSISNVLTHNYSHKYHENVLVFYQVYVKITDVPCFELSVGGFLVLRTAMRVVHRMEKRSLRLTYVMTSCVMTP
jgi:hypothetical protein